MSRIRFSIRATMILALMLAGLPVVAQAQDKHIDVTVVGSGSGAKLQFDNSECPERPNDRGCIQAAYGSSPNITWELDHSSNQEWALVRLQFSPNGVNWGDPGFPLNDCTVNDFNLSPQDRDSGIASPARPIANGQRMMLRNNNGYECITHYMIFARHRSTGQEIDSDPIIDNRGGGIR